jgi:transcriptional regulator with XRE-family HTH domain
MKKIRDDINIELICQRLRSFRESLGFESPKAFAEDLKLKYTTYRNYEIDRIPPTELLITILEKYSHHININYVLGISDAPESTIAEESMSGYGQSGKKLILDFLEDEDIKKALTGMLAGVLQNIAAKPNDSEIRTKIEQIISKVCQPPEGIQERRRCRASIDKLLC